MKDVTIDEAIRRDDGLIKIVERVTDLLEQEIGPESSEINVRWSIVHPDYTAERLVKLEISDYFNKSSSIFSEDGLKIICEHRRHVSLIRIWGDLLEARSHRQVENLKLIVQGLE